MFCKVKHWNRVFKMECLSLLCHFSPLHIKMINWISRLFGRHTYEQWFFFFKLSRTQNFWLKWPFYRGDVCRWPFIHGDESLELWCRIHNEHSQSCILIEWYSKRTAGCSTFFESEIDENLSTYRKPSLCWNRWDRKIIPLSGVFLYLEH